jgi:hypothetical protein
MREEEGKRGRGGHQRRDAAPRNASAATAATAAAVLATTRPVSTSCSCGQCERARVLLWAGGGAVAAAAAAAAVVAASEGLLCFMEVVAGGEAYRLALRLIEEGDCHGADAGVGDALYCFIPRYLLLVAILIYHDGSTLLTKKCESLACQKHADAGTVSPACVLEKNEIFRRENLLQL